MSEPTRWTCREVHWKGKPAEVVAAEDYDRLRDELDSLSPLYVAARDAEIEASRERDEARVSAAQLAEALVRIRDQGLGQYVDHRLIGATGEPWRHWSEIARAALAVFDAKEKTSPHGAKEQRA